MTIIFRCNASSVVGVGHLVRCCALAYILKQQGETCIMVGPDNFYKNNQYQEIFTEWIPVNNWKSSQEDSAALIYIAKKNEASLLVLDDYRVDENYQLSIRKAGLKWLQFSNPKNKAIWADMYIDPNPGAHVEDYKALVHNENTQLLLGPTYAILRSEFLKIKKKPTPNNTKQVLVSFGGGDDHGGIEFVLSTLLPVTPDNLRFVVVSGLINPNNNQLKEWINVNGRERVDLHINPQEVAKLFLACDIAVISGGTTTYEVDCCGLPFIIISNADNQVEQSQAWDSSGKAKYLGNLDSVNKDLFISTFKKLLNSNHIYLRNKTQTSYDGSYKVANLIINNNC